MRLWQEAFVSLVCLLAIGCRTNPNIVLLERENRELENTIYELQDCLDQYQHKLEACQRANAAVPAKAGESNSAGSSAAAEPAKPARDTSPAPTRKSQPAPPVPKEELQPPQVELPPELSPTSKSSESLKTPATISPPRSTAPAQTKGATRPAPSAGPTLSTPELLPSPAPQVPAKQTRRSGPSAGPVSLSNSQVAAISLNPRFTSGFDQDGRDGDDGVTVLIQPRDARGQPCIAAAPISVVVLDPSLAGDAARIARWDFTTEEVADLLKGTDQGEGIRLAMLWPQAPPLHDQLRLFVRYTTDKGQKLESECPIKVSLRSQQARNWAPASLPKASEPAVNDLPARKPNPMAVQPTPLPQAASGLAQPSASKPAVREAARPTWSPNRR